MTRSVAIVLKGYPRLSETFIAQEIRALELRGFDLHLISLRHPYDAKRHPIHDEIKAPVLYLPEYLYQEPLRVLRAWWAVRKCPGYKQAKAVWLKDLWRDRTANRIRRFGQALVLAHEVPQGVEWLYAHFMHTPASVTRYGAMIADLPWSCSAHAKDIWTSPEWEKREKLADCRWLVTCTAFNVAHLKTLAADQDRVDLVYHGLDLSRFPAAPQDRPMRDGSDPDQPVLFFSVGRAVAKKGYPTILEALSQLPKDLQWRFAHIGGGEDLKDLKAYAETLGIAGRIDWLGPQSQETVIAWYRKADVFVLACRITDSGDRDGLPNVFMEAQTQGLACLGTTVSAIPELIRDGETGMLVPPEDAESLAGGLERLARDPALRNRLGSAGEARVRQNFGVERGIDRLVAKFDETSVDGADVEAA